MAPPTNSATTLQLNRPRPTVPRAIVPAIPLPFIQKRKQQQAAREKAKEEAILAAQAIVEETPSSPTPPPTEISPAVANGSSDSPIAEVAEEVSMSSGPEPPPTPVIEDEVVEESGNGEPQASSIHEEIPISEETLETSASAPSEGPPSASASRSHFHMPPAFVPQSQHQLKMNSDSVKFPPQNILNGQHPMHHPHPSAGSVMFGGYPDSNNSSPAPPPSAGNVPPYPFQQQAHVGNHGPHPSNSSHGQHMSNGYSPMGPPPGYYPRQDGFVSQGPAADNYARRQMVTFGPPDGYSPSTTPLGFENQRMLAYDPTAPHSFHGSQSSAPNDQENGPAFQSQYLPALVSNGSNGNIDEVRMYQQLRPKPRTGSQVMLPVNPTANFPGQHAGPPPMVDHLDGLVPYILAQFADSELADYTLELRYSDDRAEPVRIPGHGLIFARSPTLKSLMQAQAQVNNGDGLTGKSLLIESHDRFLRSDGFWMALRRLYGGPLMDYGAPAVPHLQRNAAQSHPMPGTPADRCDLGLGYAAAGHILQIPPVVNRGAEVAGHFINWDTIERVLDFALDGGVDQQWLYGEQPPQPKCPATYGPAVNVIIYSALNFLISAFPPKFELDTSVGEPTHNPRLPPVLEDRPSVQNSRLSFIKFGDHPSEENVRSESGASVPTTLSKVLLNLPFHLLRYVLESPRLGNVEGWASTNLRQKVMYNVIEERERRRLKVLSSARTPHLQNKFEDTVHWQETVSPQGGYEGSPMLTRNWVE